MALNATEVQQLYVAYLGRAADQEGLEYWTSQSEAFTLADLRWSLVNAQEEYQELYGDLSREDLVAAIYQNMFGRAPEAEGLDYWVNGEGAAVPADDLMQLFISAASEEDSAAFQQRVADAIEGTEGQQPEEPSIPGETTMLTPDSDRADMGHDNAIGTENDDIFLAPMMSIGGLSANSLNTGDYLDGGAGYDTLRAELQSGGAVSGQSGAAIRPWTDSVENIEITALNAGQFMGGSVSNWQEALNWLQSGEFDVDTLSVMRDTVTVDAARMYDVTDIRSVNSNASLYVADLTTKTSNGEVRNTSDITIHMDHTANANSTGFASNLTVLFDQNYLLAGQQTTSSQANYWLLDQDGDQFTDTPLLNIDRDGIRFSLDGEAFTVRPADHAALDANNWEDYAQVLRDEIARMIEEDGAERLSSVVVRVDSNLTRQTFNDAGERVTIPAIVVEDTAGGEFTDLGYTIPEGLSEDFNVYGRFSTEGAELLDDPVTSNIVLEKVGRGSDGGALTIGGKSQSESSEGVEVFNITVNGDESKPSNLSHIQSTNNWLREVNIVSAEAVEGQQGYASLQVGNGNTSGYALRDVQNVDATGLLGDFYLEAGLTDAVIGKYLNATDTQGNPAADNVAFNYDLGNNATLDLEVRDSVVEREDFELNVTASGGQNDITVSIVDADGELADQDGNWLTNQAQNDNLNIVGNPSGDNVIKTPGSGNFNITTGAGNDVIYTDNTGAQSSVFSLSQSGDDPFEEEDLGGEFKAHFVFNAVDGFRGIDDLLTMSDAEYNSFANQQTQTFDFFKTNLQVEFKGFESDFIEIDSTNNATSTLQINQAIKNAINNDDQLNKLLVAKDGPGNTLIIESLIDGRMVTNYLNVDLIGPAAYNADETAAQRAVREANGQQMLDNNELDGTGLTLNDINSAVNAANGRYSTEFMTGTSGDQPITYTQTLDVSGLLAAEDVGFFDGSAPNFITVAGVDVLLNAGDSDTDIATAISNTLNTATITLDGNEFSVAASATGTNVFFTLTLTDGRVPKGEVPSAISASVAEGAEIGFLSTTQPDIGFSSSGSFSGGLGTFTSQVNTFDFSGVKVDPNSPVTLTFDWAGDDDGFGPGSFTVTIPAGAGQLQVANLVAQAFEDEFNTGETSSGGAGAVATVNGARVSVELPAQKTGADDEPRAEDGNYGAFTVEANNDDFIVEGSLPGTSTPSTTFSATNNVAVTGTISQSVNFAGLEATERGVWELFNGVDVLIEAGWNDLTIAQAVRTALDNAGIAGLDVDTTQTGTVVSYQLEGGTYTDFIPTASSQVVIGTGSIAATPLVYTYDLDGALLEDGDVLTFDIDGAADTITNGTNGDLTDGDAIAAFLDGESVTIDGVTYTIAQVGTSSSVTLTAPALPGGYTDPEDLVITSSTVDGDPDQTEATATGGAPEQSDTPAFATSNVGSVSVTPFAPTEDTSDTPLGVIDGRDSDHESDNVVNAGDGQDVVVLGTGEFSNEVVAFEGSIGHNTIVNFDDTDPAANNGGDLVDLTAYLNEEDGAISLTTGAGSLGGNEVRVIDFNALQGTADNLIGNDVAMGDVSQDALSAAINELFTLTGQNVFMINNDNATNAYDNVGEYMVVSTDGTNVQIAGVADFGDELTGLSTANLAQF